MNGRYLSGSTVVIECNKGGVSCGCVSEFAGQWVF